MSRQIIKVTRDEQIVNCDICGKKITDYKHRLEQCAVCGKDVCPECGVIFLWGMVGELTCDGWGGLEASSRDILACKEHAHLISKESYQKALRNLVQSFNKKVSKIKIFEKAGEV